VVKRGRTIEASSLCSIAPPDVFQLKAFDHSGARYEAGQAVLEF
jgi:hypothetical protein